MMPRSLARFLVCWTTLLASLATPEIAAAITVPLAGGARAYRPRSESFSEAEEIAERTEARLEAMEAAIDSGRFPTAYPAATSPAPGWSGERPMDPRANDWEPAIAADPKEPYVYLLSTRFGPGGCPGDNCPVPWIALKISADGGRTWGKTKVLCDCNGPWQYDPIIEVVPDTGDVYAVFMNGWRVMFTKSSDHGITWSKPIGTFGKVAWNDKPALATSPDGRYVYVSWNGPSAGDPWMARSKDFGQTWGRKKLVDSGRYFFAYDATVLPDGTVVFAQSSFKQIALAGKVRFHAFVSRDRGVTWRNQVLDAVQIGQSCKSQGCYPDFYSGAAGVSADADGDLVYVYDGAKTPGGPQLTFVRTSDDEGRTWSIRQGLSTPGRMAMRAMVDAAGDGDLRVAYAERSPGSHWNIFFRRSRDGGATWHAPVRISDAGSAAGYKRPRGFLEYYGDYGEIAITSQRKVVAVWGESYSYDGPGGVWFNVKLGE
jgi:hypothetical protein